MRHLLALLSALLLAGAAQAQNTASSSDRAEAKAQAQSSDSSKKSHTRRVVVVNGETVVDEETVDGKPVRSRRGGRRPAGTPDLDRLLKDLEKDLEKGLPPAARGQLRRAAKNGGSSSGSYSRRIIVENGKTIVDEETVDGKPAGRRMGGGRRGGIPGNVGVTDVDELMRQLARDMPPEARKMLERARREGTNSTSSQSHRVVVKDGKTVVDESTGKTPRQSVRGGRPLVAPRKSPEPKLPLRPIRARDRDSTDKDKDRGNNSGARPLRRLYPPKRGDK